ncbi:MAG TPA: protein kinase, partial [Polyangiaceae bacterium LLY-WYZ-15_(1-7)]|nr:protein kinase [Polyangiaceae bacterium LLY-WYZ-15_(1-7)]
MSALAQAVDRRMLGRYEIVAEIARGGMGTVYLARLEGVGGFQRLSALKLLHRHLADEAQFVTMLLDEARLAARLHHPNAVGIVDVAKSELGYYVVMEYVDGFSLEQLLDRLPPPGADDGP